MIYESSWRSAAEGERVRLAFLSDLLPPQNGYTVRHKLAGVMNTSNEQRKLAAIMFTDMVGFSAMVQRNEARAIELLEDHRQIVRAVLPEHGGREVKTTGDGFLIEFPSALAAVQAGVAIQKAMHERNQNVPEDSNLNIRIGIHVGDVLLRDGDIHGDGVNIAARLEPLAAPGGICISRAVWEQVRNKVDYPLALLGPAELKNIELPVVVHRVVMPWESAAQPVSSQRRRLLPIAAFSMFALLALLLAVVVWWPRRTPPKGPVTTSQEAEVSTLKLKNAMLFQTKFETYHPGRLPGQGGWFARGGFSSAAAKVVASGGRQFVVVSGADVEQVNSNVWSGWYFQRIPINALALHATRISVKADFEFNPGSAVLEPGYVIGMLMLTDARVVAFAGVGLGKKGTPVAQNYAHPPKTLIGKQNTNTIHHLRGDYDFGSRQATFEVDGELLGTVEFNPQAGSQPDSVSFALQSDHAVDSILRVNNVVVQVESKVREGR